MPLSPLSFTSEATILLSDLNDRTPTLHTVVLP